MGQNSTTGIMGEKGTRMWKKPSLLETGSTERGPAEREKKNEDDSCKSASRQKEMGMMHSSGLTLFGCAEKKKNLATVRVGEGATGLFRGKRKTSLKSKKDNLSRSNPGCTEETEKEIKRRAGLGRLS